MTKEVVFILDRSGSMCNLEKEVIGNYNGYLKEQKKVKDKTKLTTVLFDTEFDEILSKVDLVDAPEITEKEYFARGMTALNDAVGMTIKKLEERAKKRDTFLVFINTDGQENSSKEYSLNQVKDIILEKEKTGKWKFVFIGAGLEAASGGINLGIINTVAVPSGTAGVRSSYSIMSTMTTSYRTDEDK